MNTARPIDRILLILVLLLITCGFFIFSSASLGLLAREGARFSSVALNQFLFGIVGGVGALFLMSSVYYRNLRQYAFYIFACTLFLTLLVFVPHIGFSFNGATRWISIGSFTLQPAELLKLGFIIYLATWLSGMHRNIGDFKRVTLPFMGIIAGVGVIMLMQPDTDTFAIMAVSGVAMYLTAGGKWTHVLIMFLCGVMAIGVLALTRPYIKDRIMTFIDPTSDPLGSSYQVQQSLIAIGSGGLVGRGFGQSIQKFEYLPEPIGDSIFAVFAEEFGFIGSVILLGLLSAFTFRGYKVAAHAKDLFGMLLVVGFMTLIITQAFLNIAAMLALAPLSGLPLPFISHGGTALLATLASVGVVLNVSKYQQTKLRS